jgi:hypothetical protein
MTTQRTRTIEALELVQRECQATLAKAIHLNQVIIENRLSVPPLELFAIHATLRGSEELLKNLELRARGAVHAAGLT